MKNNAVYNINKLIKLSLQEEKRSSRYTLRKEKRFLGFIIQKAGIYENAALIGKVLVEQNDDFNLEYIIKDGSVFRKAYLKYFFEENFTHYSYYNSFENAKKAYDKFVADMKETSIPTINFF